MSKWMANGELESRFTLSKTLFKYGDIGWERDKVRKLEFIKNAFYFNDQTKCILRTTWPRTLSPRNFHSKRQHTVSVNSELLNIGTILFQPFPPTSCTKK